VFGPAPGKAGRPEKGSSPWEMNTPRSIFRVVPATRTSIHTDGGAGYGQYPPDSAPVNRPGLVQPVDSRPVVSTSVGVTLVVAGTILRFAVTSRVAHVLNTHVAGVIVMLAGVFALLLSLLVWGPLNRRRSHSGGHA
jgi:hypothetical protein